MVHLSRSSRIQSLWTFPFLMTKTQPSWTHIRKSNFCDHAAKNMYITTPIFYVNAEPHIGHAYTATLADAIARFNAMLGYSVFLSTGTDEHGTKVQKAANKMASPVSEHCTKISQKFREMCDTFQVEYSKFIRTTDKQHQEAVLHFWNCLEKNGHIYRGKYSGWYNVLEETFISSEVQIQRNPSNINEAVIVESGDVVEWMEEDTHKFRLTSFKDELSYWLSKENVVQPAVYRNMLISWLDNLEDLSISRPVERVHWGIPIPPDKSHTVYVWLDALVNYLTSVGYPDNSFREFWPPTIQVIGKDILKFHGIYWPAFLMAAGLEPPKKLVCHAHWAVKDKKMSKSKGNIISPFSAMHDFTEDGLRYFLLRRAVLDTDANYNALKIRETLNDELANTLGNLLNRCFGESINPDRILYRSVEYNRVLKSRAAWNNINALEKISEKAKKYYDKCHLCHVVETVMDMLRIANQMFECHRPWRLKNSEDLTSKRELEAVISLTLENIRVAALVLHPIIPRLTSNLLDSLQISIRNRTWEDTKPLHLTNVSNETKKVLPRNMIFFRKIQDTKITQKEKKHSNC